MQYCSAIFKISWGNMYGTYVIKHEMREIFFKNYTDFLVKKGHIWIRHNYSGLGSNLTKKFLIRPGPDPQQLLFYTVHVVPYNTAFFYCTFGTI